MNQTKIIQLENEIVGSAKHVNYPTLTFEEQLKETITHYKKIQYELTDDQITQQEFCLAVAFNKEGVIMVAGCGCQIKIYRLENGELKEQFTVLEGHTQHVTCLVFSKKTNWFASSSQDCTIRSWQEMANDKWSNSQPQKIHTNQIWCILLNHNEDQLISGSCDKSIKIWRLNQQNNEIFYEYSLDKHTCFVVSMSLNESETIFVSYSHDKQIIIWGKEEKGKWEYKYSIKKSVDDYGSHICFINDNIIAWQQLCKGCIHIFQFENERFIEKPELKVDLEQNCGNKELFPSVFNKQQQVFIQRYNKQVYIIRVLNATTQFKIVQEPINCNSEYSYQRINIRCIALSYLESYDEVVQSI